MRQRTAIFLLSSIVLGLITLFGAAPFALGSPVGQQDATHQQATVDALVMQRFTQTAQASGLPLTATAEAQNAAATVFALTVDAAFNQALTATAAAPIGVQAAESPVATLEATAEPIEAAAYLVLLAPESPVASDVLQQTAAAVESRLRALDVSAVVTVIDSGQIQVEMDAPEDLEATLASIQQAGLLEFVDFSGLLDQMDDFVDETIVTGDGQARAGALLNPLTDAPFEVVVTGADISSASAVLVDTSWGVQFDFTEHGGAAMVAFTGAHIGEPLAIVLDGHVLSIPIIQSEFGATGGFLQGAFTEGEANRLALQLNVGALPVGLQVVNVEPLAAQPEALAAAPTATAPTLPAATPDLRPTATTGQIQVAEEVFEGGRMFYIQPLDQIWVMVVAGEGSGTWSIYPDTFEEGDAEVDPSLTPPEGLMQPERGFGKLWRENEQVRQDLGWAVTPEFGYVSEYRYQPGGQLGPNGEYTPAPGYHILFSLYDEAFQFNEADNTWQLHKTD